jgi:hypothetical protein
MSIAKIRLHVYARLWVYCLEHLGRCVDVSFALHVTYLSLDADARGRLFALAFQK